jgi:hypothetical protein
MPDKLDGVNVRLPLVAEELSVVMTVQLLLHVLPPSVLVL